MGVQPRNRGERISREALPEDCRVLQQCAILRIESIQPRGDQRLQRLGHLEVLERPGELVGDLAGAEDPAVRKHADRLHGVERNALRARHDPGRRIVWCVGHESANELLDRLVGKGLEMDGREGPLPGAPVGPAVDELGPRQRHHKYRMGPRPLEHGTDEVDQPGIGPLQVLEHHHHRAGSGDPLEEGSPRGVQLLAAARWSLVEREQEREPGLHPGALLRIGDVLRDRRPELRTRLLGAVSLGIWLASAPSRPRPRT